MKRSDRVRLERYCDMYIVVCYDITSNRRRTRLHELLLGYGAPVQKSVFECNLTLTQFRQLRSRARRYVKGSGDSIRYYHLCGRCQGRTQEEGTPLVETGGLKDFFV
ncbi:MAG: CRISPR-associated endonuclease Cas2 [Chloroflexota bacterium]|nr:CRISPR-associated endonuclease Cas2 [Chloroflexota bacterium]